MIPMLTRMILFSLLLCVVSCASLENPGIDSKKALADLSPEERKSLTNLFEQTVESYKPKAEDFCSILVFKLYAESVIKNDSKIQNTDICSKALESCKENMNKNSDKGKVTDQFNIGEYTCGEGTVNDWSLCTSYSAKQFKQLRDFIDKYTCETISSLSKEEAEKFLNNSFVGNGKNFPDVCKKIDKCDKDNSPKNPE